MVSRALRAISKPNCGWLRPCTLGRFSLYGQRKATKRKPPRMAPLIRRSAALGPALSQRVILTRGPVARIPARDPFGALTQSLAVLGGAIRGLNAKSIRRNTLRYSALRGLNAHMGPPS